MPRPVNAIDFWRGFALVSIFINHIPGIFYERFTHRNLSLSDSAELFVFLAGWSLRHVVGRPDDPTPAKALLLRLMGRALTVYAAHMTIVMVAIAMLALASRLTGNPLLLEWHNAAAVFQDPVDAHIGLALLTHQLGYFDILPLYVVLMLIAPLIALVHRQAPALLLPLSVAVYLTALVFKITCPTWPNDGQWFFNPLCWQLVFVLGFSLARNEGPGRVVRAHLPALRLAGLPIVIGAAPMVWYGWLPDALAVPEPKLLFIAAKSFVTPMRLIHFLALAAVASVLFATIARHVPSLVAALSLLGRNSLYVFCTGSLLSLVGQILRFYFRGGIVLDTILVGVGIGLLLAVGWLGDQREGKVKVV